MGRSDGGRFAVPGVALSNPNGCVGDLLISPRELGPGEAVGLGQATAGSLQSRRAVGRVLHTLTDEQPMLGAGVLHAHVCALEIHSRSGMSNPIVAQANSPTASADDCLPQNLFEARP